MRYATVSLLLALAGCTCSSLPVAVQCNTDSECAAGERCAPEGCVPASGGEDAGDPGFTFGDDAGTCAVPCGTLCCADGEACEAGACRKDCGALTRCGEAGKEACCAASELCYLGACITPGATCTVRGDCKTTEYCDPTVGKCLPLATGTNCEYRPPAEQFNPGPLWSYTPTTDAFTQVMMSPVVVDVNRDGVPDVLANYFSTSAGYGGAGVMRALSGDDGRVLWTTADVAADHIHPPASIAAADLDGSGKVVVITVAHDGTLVAFEGATGKQVWKSHDAAGAAVTCSANWGGPAIADLDADGDAEVVCGLTAFDHTGKVLWNHGLGGGAVGPLSAVADLDGDGLLDVSDGSKAYKADGSALPGFTGAGYAGLPATGDFMNGVAVGRDGKPELVSVGGGKIALVNGQTGAVIAGPSALPGWNSTACVPGGGNPGNGGPPTVADFDGDGEAEIGVADLDCYTVFKPTVTGGVASLAVLWSKKVQDHSSSVTGSSVFDFEGDGKAEVVYADEVLLHVFRGSDGTEIFKANHCSGTTYENPVIVDVDGNGRADIVLCENTYAAAGLGCASTVKPGIQVLHDVADNWVNTRAIWNQHAYHVTNVCDGLDQVCGGKGAPGNGYARLPRTEPKNWSFANGGTKTLNNYRQNVQGDGLFAAPDLTGTELYGDKSQCGSATLVLAVRVVNKGSLGVRAGLPVAFYKEGTPRALLGVAKTRGQLLPGQSEVVSYTWSPSPKGLFKFTAVVDDDGAQASTASECDEKNNTAGPIESGCPAVQ